MSDLPLVSVITVVYNGAAFLEQCMVSVLGQTYTNVEYILIDGGSTDGTIEIIRKYQDSLAFWVSEPDKGISDAFNKGIAHAKGALIGIINADDWYQPNAVQLAVDAFNKGAMVIHGKQQYWVQNQQKWVADYVFSANHDHLPKEMTINHPTVFVATEVYRKYGTFLPNLKYAMDYELMLRFWQAKVSFEYVPVVVSNMRLAGASDTHWKKAYQESYQAKLLNGIPASEAYPYYLKMVVRTAIARILPKLGLEIVLKWFRSKFALTTKSN